MATAVEPTDVSPSTSLRDQLVAREQQFTDTGAYSGLNGELALKESAPILFEKVFSRLRGGMVTARETALNISASPIVKELGELCFAVYTPEGDSVALSTGVIVHVHTMSEAIKYMIRQGYEENPGIQPGDIFCNNDSLIGDVHNADVQTIIPIHIDGRLVGWVAGVTHVIEIGASTPGSLPLGPISRFEDGIDIPARKIGANDELFRDHVQAAARGTRLPHYWTLDERTRLAGCLLARRQVEALIEDVGVDTYLQFCAELIEDGRRAFRSSLFTMTVPGRYRAPAFSEMTLSQETLMPLHARIDSLMHAPVEVRVTADARLELDLEGASAWGYHSANCTTSAMQGGAMGPADADAACQRQDQRRRLLRAQHQLPVGQLGEPPEPAGVDRVAMALPRPELHRGAEVAVHQPAGPRVRRGGTRAVCDVGEHVPGRRHRPPRPAGFGDELLDLVRRWRGTDVQRWARLRSRDVEPAG